MFVRNSVVVLVGAVLAAGACARSGGASAPAWDGVAPGYRNQVWRMTGRLIAPGGRAFSYAVTVFRYALPRGDALYPASVSIVDESTGRLFTERRTERAGLGLAEATTGPLSIRVGTWRLCASRIADGAPAFVLDVKLARVALVVRGVARKRRFALRSDSGQVEGYSLLASEGSVMLEGRRFAVGGMSWLDHAFSNRAPEPAASFAQLRVQLDDGRELYVETSSSADAHSGRRRAYLIDRHGSVETLARDAYQFGPHPAGTAWRSPHTGALYPNIWELHVNGKTPFLSLEPVTFDQESLANGNGRSFWDGAADVYDVTPWSQGLRLGSGYVLLTGYAPPGGSR